MDTTFLHGKIILEDRVLEDGAVVVQQGAIAWLGPTSVLQNKPEPSVDLGGFYLCPGFIDLHVHGGGGVDSMVGDPEALKTIVRTHEAFGTTSLCLATLSAPIDQLHRALASIHQLAARGTGGARLLGSYLEGPFINPARCGPHPVEHILEPDLRCLQSCALAAGGWLRVVSLAPEMPDADKLIRWTVHDMGLIAAIGHTSATCEQTEAAIQAGCRLCTHLFNNMMPFHHRDPNAAGAVLASQAAVAELVMEPTHVHPAAARIALRCLGADRLALITDATSVVGSPDGTGLHGGRRVIFQDGVAQFEDGHLAGSALTMIDAVRAFISQAGVEPAVAVRCASLVPARLLGIGDRLGSIAVGKHADLLVLDPSDLRVLQTYVGGARIYKTDY
ncbi:MAG TPA: N-acetylglucosamine-6-phosphate deacetylase [Myxococcota bacterium]|nr:N-acetylglucosamine-6-phosphate deacetylase [Myxococcota bacterium]HRY92900.1 N-acetylglucosamine-6-phosphate deacetylase [Myxococcota bacterium]HSA20893.1 N-acetylglucosamine-6-phosphate deacetylase [Myxococcota bacterium]